MSIERSEARSELTAGRVSIERSEARSELTAGRVSIERADGTVILMQMTLQMRVPD